MSKKSFKNEIRNRYKGRGNSWVRIEKNTQTYNSIINHLENLNLNEENCGYYKHILREGYAWIRFSNPEGCEENPLTRFEVRYNNCKYDQPDSFLIIEDNTAKEFSLLGNTPFKLQLETDPINRKSKSSKPSSILKNKLTNLKDKDKDTDSIDIERKATIIKEIALTKPTNNELEEWYEFLKVNNLYEENV
jgi:hypothetical protein